MKKNNIIKKNFIIKAYAHNIIVLNIIMLILFYPNQSNSMNIFKNLFSCCSQKTRSEKVLCETASKKSEASQLSDHDKLSAQKTNLINSIKDSDVYYAIIMSDLNLISKLAEAKKLKTFIKCTNSTLLHIACQNIESGDLNLSLFCDVQARSKKKTILNIIKLLLKNGGSEYIDTVDDNGKTPLYLACQKTKDWASCGNEFTNIIELLIINGANIDLDKDYKGNIAEKSKKTATLFDITKRFFACLENNECFNLSEQETAQDNSLQKFVNALKANMRKKRTKILLLKMAKNKKLIDFQVICQ